MFLKGVLVSMSLIVAIGSQNAFILKNALKQNHIFVICTVCFLCDFVLMGLGVFGLGSLLATNAFLGGTLALLGAVFLLVYGGLSFKNALSSSDVLDLDDSKAKPSLKATIVATLAITLLNPHVYLDTVVIVGGIAGVMSFEQKLQFLFGALLSSFVWFFALGFGAKFLLPIFKKPKAWRLLEFLIGCIMWYIAFGLIGFVLVK